MMKRLFPVLISVVLLASPAGALKMSIWDRDMQTPLGSGDSSGSKFNVQLTKNFSGPVVVVFSQTDEEKRTGSFTGLQTRYDGVLKNGVLTVMSELPEKSDNKAEPSRSPNTQAAPASAYGSQASAAISKSLGLSLTKLLQPFKLMVNVQTTGQTNPGDPENMTPRTTTYPVAELNFKSLEFKK